MASYGAMGMMNLTSDPYKILSIPRNSTQEQIRRAYKKACLKYHPDKHPPGDAKIEAEKVFKLIVYAYTQLTDNNNHNNHNNHNNNNYHAQTKSPPRTPPTPPSSRMHTNTTSTTEDDEEEDDDDDDDDEGDIHMNMNDDHDDDDTDSQKSNCANMNYKYKNYYSNTSKTTASEQHPNSNTKTYKLPDREVDLPLTLEELSKGCIKRRKLRVQGTCDQLLPVLTISIKPGYRPGDRIRFKSAWTPPGQHLSVDVVFIISQKHHNIFTLDGDDLKLTMRLNLVDALTGALLVVKTLDEKPLNLLLEPVISPSHVEKVKQYGMPRRSDPSKKGDLLVSFDICFPTNIDVDYKPIIRELFSKFDKNTHNVINDNNKYIKRNIRRSSSVFVNNPNDIQGNGISDSQNLSHEIGVNSTSKFYHSNSHNSTHNNDSNHHNTSSTKQQSFTLGSQRSSSQPHQHSQHRFNHHRRSSTNHDAGSDFASSRGPTSDRRDDSSQHSSQPQSKSRRRFANIFR